MLKQLLLCPTLTLANMPDWDPRSKLFASKNVFDSNGKAGGKAKSTLPPCPKVEELSPFWRVAMVDKVMYVCLEEEDEECHELLGMGGQNYTALVKAAKIPCGEGGHSWATRLIEETSITFWAAGAEKYSEGEEMDILLEIDGKEVEKTVSMTEEKYKNMKSCWWTGCGCQQAAVGFFTKLAIAIAVIIGLAFVAYDTHLTNEYEKKRGERKEERAKTRAERALKKKDTKKKSEKKNEKEEAGKEGFVLLSENSDAEGKSSSKKENKKDEE